MSSNLKQLVSIGVTGLTDPLPLQTPRSWFKNGDRGNLHSDQHCHKVMSRGASTLELSYVQAVNKRLCSNCCESRALPHGLERTLRVLCDVDNLLTLFANESVEAKFAQDLGSLIDLVSRARIELDTLDENQRELAAKAVAADEARLADAARTIAVIRDRIAGGLVPWAASRLMLVDGGEFNTAPGVWDGDVALYGTSFNRSGSNIQLASIYECWVKRRKTSKERADTVALEVFDSLGLLDISQLDFPVGHLESTEGSSLLAIAQQHWRDEARRRLTERLLPAWEKRWCDYVTQTEPLVVGMTVAPTQDSTRGVLASFPRHGRVALVPAVVALWLVRSESRYGRTFDGLALVHMAKGCSPELLQTIDVLWDHRNTSSPYNLLDAAVDAAQAV